MNKKCYIIAGPNGAGKTTFAKDFLPKEGACMNYINADLIAAGLSPFAPEKVSLMAGKLMLLEIDKCVAESRSFAFETTLSGVSYLKKIANWKLQGYENILLYFSLPTVAMAIARVKARVAQGGHNIPNAVITRRFARSKKNFDMLYKPVADSWAEFDSTAPTPKLIDNSSNYE